MTQLAGLFPVAFSLVLMAIAVPKLWHQSNMEATAGGPVGGPFHLLASDGRAVTERSWPGRYLLIYFGYTHCPAACPTALNDMALALQTLGARGVKVQPLFITFDPQRDTRDYLARYTAMFGPRILGLTGTAAETADAARRYGIEVERLPTGPDPDDYEFQHSSVITLMRPDGSYLASLRADEGPERLARDIAAAIHT